MPRRRKGRVINGIVLLNKAVGGSSNQVLQQVRRLYQAQKAGHTGALDPLASGMLPICLGEATKFSQFLLDADKTYQVTARLGIRTTTSDADGEVVSERPITANQQQILAETQAFIGTSMQVPSMYSALKYQGKPLYSYAREGITVPREARSITVYSLTVDCINLPNIEMTIRCSKGTYIRSLVDDLGENLGCGAYVTKLHRTDVANYPSAGMLTMEALEAKAEASGLEGLDQHLLPMDTAVLSLPQLAINAEQTTSFFHGQAVPAGELMAKLGEFVRVYGVHQGVDVFCGVGVMDATGEVQPKRVVVYEN